MTLTNRKSNEAYIAQVGFFVSISMCISMYILRQYNYTWIKTVIFSYITGHLIYALMATDNIISTVCLNLLTYLFNMPIIGHIIGYIGFIGLLLISPIYLIMN